MNKTSCKFTLVVLGLLFYTWQASAQPSPQQPTPQFESKAGIYQLTLAGAEHFADLPLRCMQR